MMQFQAFQMIFIVSHRPKRLKILHDGLQVKFAWKIQRDMAERGHSLESIKASIEARKPDFDAYIDPQKQKADVIIQVHLMHAQAHSACCCYTWNGKVKSVTRHKHVSWLWHSDNGQPS